MFFQKTSLIGVSDVYINGVSCIFLLSIDSPVESFFVPFSKEITLVDSSPVRSLDETSVSSSLHLLVGGKGSPDCNFFLNCLVDIVNTLCLSKSTVIIEGKLKVSFVFSKTPGDHCFFSKQESFHFESNCSHFHQLLFWFYKIDCLSYFCFLNPSVFPAARSWSEKKNCVVIN